MLQVKALLFDVDGTVLDAREFIIQATEHALLSLGYPVPDRSIIASQVGKPFQEYYVNLSGSKEVDSLIDEHRKFQYSNMHLAKPFADTLNTLKNLREQKFKLAAVTTRSKKTSVETLERAGIKNLFDVIISAEDSSALKPDPAPLFTALKFLEEKPELAVMIGDSHLDIEAGKNAGTKTIRATYGFHNDHLHDPEPDFIITEISELENLLRN